jgi:hypothetical protein
MTGQPEFKTQQFIDAIPGTGGIVSAIARKVGCAWHTARKYIDAHPTVRLAYDSECESVLDLAEAQTIKAIKDGDTQMIRYYLSTKGKRRGYTERLELEIDERAVDAAIARELAHLAAGGKAPDAGAAAPDEASTN